MFICVSRFIYIKNGDKCLLQGNIFIIILRFFHPYSIVAPAAFQLAFSDKNNARFYKEFYNEQKTLF